MHSENWVFGLYCLQKECWHKSLLLEGNNSSWLNNNQLQNYKNKY